MRFPPSATPRHHANPMRSEPMTKAATASSASAAANLPLRSADLAHLEALHRRLLWLSCWTIHNANHLRDKGEGEVKVGGHQASSASMAAILTALYFHVLRPEDRVSVKPHAGPVFHAIQYLMGAQTRDRLMAFRGYGGVQSYPSRTKDVDDVDFSTGSVGLGASITIFASLVQDYLRCHGRKAPLGRMVALIGDAELDEGNIYEALQGGWKHDLRNVWWVIDYNRQSLDGVVREGLFGRIEASFATFGWRVVRLKYGALQRAAFAEPGGEKLRDWIDACPNALYSALTFQGGAAWRKRLLDDLGDQGPVSALIGRRSDAELAAMMENLGGHCLASLCEAFDAATGPQPTVFLAYTIKGWGTPLAGHKDNHAGLMTPAQFAQFQQAMAVPAGAEWEPFAGVPDEAGLREFLSRVPFFAKGQRRFTAPALPVPPLVSIAGPVISTQAGFGKILDEVARSGGPLADRVITTSPDVTVSTNLGGWVNRRGLFARTAEGGAHQSIGTPLIGMALDGLAAFEPAFVDELSIIMDWSFHHLQRHGGQDLDTRTSLADAAGGSVYLRLSTRPVEQPLRCHDPQLAQGVIDGAYWLREPGPNAEVVIAYQGAVAPEAIAAATQVAQGRGAARRGRPCRDLCRPAARRMDGGTACGGPRVAGRPPARTAAAALPDRHGDRWSFRDPSLAGHRTVPLGVERFGQTGTIAELYRHFGIDTAAIVSAVNLNSPGRPLAVARG